MYSIGRRLSRPDGTEQMIETVVFVAGLILAGLIGFGTWISGIKQADVSTLTVVPIAKALALPLLWAALCTVIIVTGFSAAVIIQIESMLP